MKLPSKSASHQQEGPPAKAQPLRRAALGVVLVAVLTLSACATVTGRISPGQRLDPFENWNRKVFAFNEGLDEKVLKPIATVYSNTVPQPVRQGVANFFNNAADAWSAVNNLLQGKLASSLSDVMRVGTNTVFGLAGFSTPRAKSA